MKPKKILLVTHYYLPHTGGIEYVARNQAAALAGLGHLVDIVTSRFPSQEPPFIKGVVVKRVRVLNFLEKRGVPFPLFSPRLIPVLSKSIKAADVVHVHDAFYVSSWCAAVLARRHKRPLVLTQHVDHIPHKSRFVRLVQKAVYSSAGKAVFRRSSRIIVLNERVRSFLVANRVDDSKIIFMANGVDNNLFRPPANGEKAKLRRKYHLSADKPIILFVGRMVFKKGFNLVLASKSQRYQIVIAGDDCQHTGPAGVKFLGKLPQDLLAEIYRAADIFLLPSQGEGFPLAVQEAMASGLPVIMSYDEAYDAYGLDPELIYLLPKRPQAKDVQTAIDSVLADAGQRKKMAAYSRHYARIQFDWQSVAGRLDGIYAELLGAVEGQS